MKNINLDLSQEDFLLFLEGNQRIFRLVFDRYHDSLYSYVRSLSQQTDEIDDIVQQCFIQLFNYKSAIKDSSGIYPYLFVIAKRLVIMSFRKQVLEAKYQKETILMSESSCSKTEKQIDFNELQDILYIFIEMLPPQQREIYRLNKIDGYSYDEISLATGRSRNTIKNQIITASKKIKKLITRHYLTFLAIFLFSN